MILLLLLLNQINYHDKKTSKHECYFVIKKVRTYTFVINNRAQICTTHCDK